MMGSRCCLFLFVVIVWVVVGFVVVVGFWVVVDFVVVVVFWVVVGFDLAIRLVICIFIAEVDA